MYLFDACKDRKKKKTDKSQIARRRKNKGIGRRSRGRKGERKEERREGRKEGRKEGISQGSKE